MLVAGDGVVVVVALCLCDNEQQKEKMVPFQDHRVSGSLEICCATYRKGSHPTFG